MILNDILVEIDERYPNGLSSVSKVRKINNLQNRLFRTVVKRTVATNLNMIKDLSVYLVPISPFKIREIIVDGTRYQNRQLEGTALTNFFYILDDGIGLHPTPQKDLVDGIMIFHYQEPTELSSNSLDVVPDLDPDFHSLLIYGVCKELAEIDQRFDIANGFSAQYNNDLELFEIANQDTEPAQIQEEAW